MTRQEGRERNANVYWVVICLAVVVLVVDIFDYNFAHESVLKKINQIYFER